MQQKEYHGLEVMIRIRVGHPPIIPHRISINPEVVELPQTEIFQRGRILIYHHITGWL
jgi:hypothetical protein